MMPAILLGAGLVALALLLALYWRTSQRIAEMNETMERLKVMQRDMTADVRARLDEGARAWENVEHEMRPRVEQLEPAIADLSSTLEEHLPAMGEARTRLKEVEEHAAAMQAKLEREAKVSSERIDRIEDAVRTLRDAADERLADAASLLDSVAARVATLEEGDAVAGEDPVAAVEAATDAPATYGSGPTRRRMGKKARKPSRWRFWRSRTESASH